MDEGEARLKGAAPGFQTGLVIGVAVEHHRGPKGGHGTHLHLRCGERHHDHGLAAEAVGRQRHPLGVVARTGGDHPPLEFIGAEVGHAVVGAAQLEREHRLQVFPFQQHVVADAAREIRRHLKRRLDRHVVDAGAQNPLEIITHQPSVTRAGQRPPAGRSPLTRRRFTAAAAAFPCPLVTIAADGREGDRRLTCTEQAGACISAS